MCACMYAVHAMVTIGHCVGWEGGIALEHIIVLVPFISAATFFPLHFIKFRLLGFDPLPPHASCPLGIGG